MSDSKLIDSSVWIDYLTNGNFKEIIDIDEVLLISSLSIFEIKKKLLRNKITQQKVEKSVEFIKKRSLVVPVDLNIAEKAVDKVLKTEGDVISVEKLVKLSLKNV